MQTSRASKNVIYTKGKSESRVPMKDGYLDTSKIPNEERNYSGKPNLIKTDKGDFPRIKKSKYA